MWIFMCCIKLLKCWNVEIRRIHGQSVHPTAIPTNKYSVLFRHIAGVKVTREIIIRRTPLYIVHTNINQPFISGSSHSSNSIYETTSPCCFRECQTIWATPTKERNSLWEMLVYRIWIAVSSLFRKIKKCLNNCQYL